MQFSGLTFAYIEEVVNKPVFAEEELNEMHNKIDKAGIQLPKFSDLKESEHLQVLPVIEEEKPVRVTPATCVDKVTNVPENTSTAAASALHDELALCA